MNPETHSCDCGYTWRHGHSGTHLCGPQYRATIERQEQEVLKLHRDLAAEKLRADQGWHRYEAANSRKNELEAERANWAQEIVALKASMPADENAQPVIMSEDDAEQFARSKWTVKQWYEHVGAWENAQGEVCFGSVMALGAMLKLMAKARHFVAPVAQQDAISAAKDPIRELIALHAQELDQNDYAYFELARTRRTGWMAWICANLVDNDPGRKVLATGQGSTPEEACSNAIMDYTERAKN